MYSTVESIEQGTNFHYCDVVKGEPEIRKGFITVAIHNFSSHPEAVKAMLARRKELKKHNLLADPSYRPPSRRNDIP